MRSPSSSTGAICSADPDTSRVTSVEDFHRARFLYQLTHAGEAAERSLAVFDERLAAGAAPLPRQSHSRTSPPGCALSKS